MTAYTDDRGRMVRDYPASHNQNLTLYESIDTQVDFPVGPYDWINIYIEAAGLELKIVAHETGAIRKIAATLNEAADRLDAKRDAEQRATEAVPA